MIEGRTGSFIAADLFNAGVIESFGGFPNIFKDISESKKAGKGKINAASTVAGIIGLLVMLPVFVIAVSLLCGINESFDVSVSRFLNSVFSVINVKWIFRNSGYFIFAVPASLYLYGLLSNCAGSTGEKEKGTFAKLLKWRESCHMVPQIMASVITGCFTVLYLVFFCFEGSYLFSAFAGRLPEEFTAAEYARKGFFELTGIMFINMLVFVLVSYFSRRETVWSKISSGMIIALMSESVVFAAVSFSKLALYYSRFGYTPKRLLAMWGTLIFAAGAVMVIVHILKRRDMSRAWIYFTTGSFTLMNIISSVLFIMFQPL